MRILNLTCNHLVGRIQTVWWMIWKIEKNAL